MHTLRGMSLRLFRANYLVIITSIIGIMVATTLIVTMVTYSLNANETMNSSFRDLYGNADMLVGYEMEDTHILTESLIDQLSAQDEIEEVAEVAVSHLTLDEENLELYTIGVEYNDLTTSRFKYKEEIDESAVIINEGLATALGYNLGDNIAIEGEQYQVIEIMEDIKGTSEKPDLLIMHQNNVKSFLSPGEEATYLMLKGKEAFDLLEVVDNIKKMDDNFRVEVFEQDQVILSNFKTLNTFIIMLSILIAAVTALLVISNFEIILYKIKNQIAILRCIGATTKQVMRIIILNSIIINATGVLLGVILVVLGVHKMFTFAEEKLSLYPATDEINIIQIVLIALICFIIFQLFMFIPAYRSTKILPLKIMSENERLDFSGGTGKLRFMKVLMIISVILLVFGYVFSYKNDVSIVIMLVGILLLLITLILSLPILLTKCISIIQPIIEKTLGSESIIAIQNLLPQVKKNTFAIISISSLMVITVFGSTLLNTIQKNSETHLLNQFETPIVMENRLSEASSLDPFEVSDEIGKVPGVRGSYFFNGLDLKYYLDENNENKGDINVAVTNGEIVRDIPDDSIIVSAKFAKGHKLKQGDNMKVGVHTADLSDVILEGIYKIALVSDDLEEGTDMIIGWTNPLNNYSTFSHMFIQTTNEMEALDNLDDFRVKYPELKISSFNEAQAESFQMFLQRWSIFIIVIIVLVVSTLLGVFNSLLNMILSKRKEYAVLRSLGLTPRGIVKVILTQIILYVITGLILGTVIGIILSLVTMLIDPVPIVLSLNIIVSLSAFIIVASTVFFIVVGNKITKHNVIEELHMDGK